MGADGIPLRLRQELRQPRGAIGIEIREAYWDRDTHAAAGRHYAAPAGLHLLQPGGETAADERVRQIRPLGVSLQQQVEDAAPDNAAALPDAGDLRQRHVPGMRAGCGADQMRSPARRRRAASRAARPARRPSAARRRRRAPRAAPPAAPRPARAHPQRREKSRVETGGNRGRRHGQPDSGLEDPSAGALLCRPSPASSSRSLPVASSRTWQIRADSSRRNDSRSPSFQLANRSPISVVLRPAPRERMRLHVGVLDAVMLVSRAALLAGG
jgi:hypothetical protein